MQLHEVICWCVRARVCLRSLFPSFFPLSLALSEGRGFEKEVSFDFRKQKIWYRCWSWNGKENKQK